MENSPLLYISNFGDGEYIEEGNEEQEEEEEEDMEDNDKEDSMETDMTNSHRPKDHHLDTDLKTHRLFRCQHCERHFSSKQGLERHIYIHVLANHKTHTFKCKYCSKRFVSKIGRRRHERRHENVKLRHASSKTSVESPGLFSQAGVEETISSPKYAATSILADEEQAASLAEQGDLGGAHVCKHCDKVFSTHTNKRRHERRTHERHLCNKEAEKAVLPPEENLQSTSSTKPQQEPQPGDNSTCMAAQQNGGEQVEQYMLDVSSNISENLSFYIDGKIVSTSTVSSCEVVEINGGSATLVGLDAVILDPAQIGQMLNIEAASGKEIPGQLLTKKRTATPPLLPQIKTQLESEVVVSSSATSSSASVVSSLIENLLPQNTDSTVAHKERTVFLSPKLKQLLEKQDGLNPTLAVITDGQRLCSPLSLTVLPAVTGRFKRRTGSPTRSPQQSPTSNVVNTMADLGESDVVSATPLETQLGSPQQILSNEKDDTPPPVEEPIVTQVLPDTWPSATGGNSCNQQPLDLSNAIKKNEDVTLAEAALDLRLQRKSTDEPESTLGTDLQPLPKRTKPNTCVLEKVLMNEYAKEDVAQDLSVLGNPEAPLATDFAIVSTSDMVTPVESVTERLVCGLALPTTHLTPSPSALTPVVLQPSPCTFALAAPASHAVLPTTSSLITVLAPPSGIPSPPNQPIQLLAPNISPEPLVICTDTTLHPSQCDLTTAFASANAANLVTLSQPVDPSLNLPGHVFLTDQIALNAPVIESTIGSEVPFTPTVTLNNPLINSYNITSNTVLIECTIALDTPGNLAPTAITLQENSVEPAAPTQMVINHIEQQQILSVPTPETVDPTILVSSISESVTLSSTPAVMTDDPAVSESNPAPEPVVTDDQPTPTEKTTDDSESTSETNIKTPPSESADEGESSTETPGDEQQQTFTKNFICNVCEKLFHSMKELGDHVSDHADEWPYKCEFCLLVFDKTSALHEHRSNLHGVGKTYVCSACTKEFVYLCNLKHHQEELHPGQQCTYTEDEKGKLRPQNYNNLTKVKTEVSVPCASKETQQSVKKEESVDSAAEELLTTIKIMATDGHKLQGPDVRLGINQHYPSFKPPPFPYHNRSPAGSVASATNFTTHNIPQTFSTAIRCTKCGNSFDNMPELHKHILACANASDKKRYTPKKNPIPLRHFAKAQNGVLSTTNTANGLNHTRGDSVRSKTNQEPPTKMRLHTNKRKKRLVQRVVSHKNKVASSSNRANSSVDEEQEVFVCPHCSREFTLRRSRTKHMAVCPMKPKEVKKRKDGGVSVTKENNGHLRRGVAHLEEKRQSSAQDHKLRDQSSRPANRPSVMPAQTVLSSRKTRMLVKESALPKQETPTLGDLPIVRTFNPSMRQYRRVQHGVKDLPIKITIVKPQQVPPPAKRDEQLADQGREGAVGGSLLKSAKDQQGSAL